jgi:hypothetical protein
MMASRTFETFDEASETNNGEDFLIVEAPFAEPHRKNHREEAKQKDEDK